MTRAPDDSPPGHDDSHLPTLRFGDTPAGPAGGGAVNELPTLRDAYASQEPVAAEPPEASPPAATRDDAHYDRQEVVGRGGMGEVVRVYDRGLCRHVVMKTLHRQASRDAGSHGRFVAEARVTGQLSHPNIVPVHDVGVTRDGEPFFTMKHVEGEDLGGLIARLKDGDRSAQRRYPLPRRLELFRAICNAVAFAHARGVIHRDLKPANVMVGSFGEVLVMDWGLAKVVFETADQRQARRQTVSPEAAASAGADGDPLMTQDGAIMGTPAYMPPEQAAGDLASIDRRSDVYSLGAVLFELLCLRPPYAGGRVWDVLAQVNDGQRVAPGAGPGDPPVPRELVAVIDKAMALEPRRRYQSVEALVEDLIAFSDHRAIAAARYSPLQRAAKWLQRHRAAAIAATLAAAALIAGVAVNNALRSRDAAATLRSRQAQAWQALEAAKQTRDAVPASAGDAWYSAQAAVLAQSRTLADVDATPRAQAELATAARDLARRLGADDSPEMGRLLLEEARDARLPEDVVALERWLLETSRERRGQHAALEIRALLDRVKAEAIDPQRALRRIVAVGRYPACTQVLVRALLLEGQRSVLPRICVRALGQLGDRRTRTTISGRMVQLAKRGPDKKLLLRAQDEPRIAPLTRPLRLLTDRCGRPPGQPEEPRELTPAQALALYLHARVIQNGVVVATEEISLVSEVLEALTLIADAPGRALLGLWQWRQGPDSLGWAMAERTLRQLGGDPDSWPTQAGFAPALQRALLLLSAARWEDALAALRAVEGADTRGLRRYLHAFALHGAGRFMEAQRAAGLAAQAAHQSASEDPEDARPDWSGPALRLQGQALLAAGQRSAALRVLALAGERGDPHALERLAALREAEGALETADALARKALELDSRAQSARLLRCRLAARRGDGKTLIRLATEAIAMDPGTLEGRLMLAEERRRRGEVADARALCDAVLHRAADHGPALLMRGRVWLDIFSSRYNSKLGPLAIADLERAVELMPGDPQPVRFLTQALVADLRIEDALARVKQLERRAERSGKALRAWVLWTFGQHREAFATAHGALQGASGKEPLLRLAALVRGAVYRGGRQWAPMRADFQLARRSGGPTWRAQVDLEHARGEAIAGQLGAAIAVCRRALEEGGSGWQYRPEAQSHLSRWLMWRAGAHARRGDRRAAIADLEAAIEVSRSGYIKQQLRKQLEALRGR